MTEQITIRSATLADAEALVRLHVRSWQWASASASFQMSFLTACRRRWIDVLKRYERN